MGMIPDEKRKELTSLFSALETPVTLVTVTQEFECRFCSETRGLMEETAGISDRISVRTLDFKADEAAVREYGIDKTPAVAVVGKRDYGIRFFGIPSGYEYASLVEDIVDVSRGRTGLPDEIKKRVAAVNAPVHIQVFVSPTCPYCPAMVRIAHQFAIENDRITADMIEIGEFTELANKYDVFSVPKTVINETIEIEGVVSAEVLIAKVEEAAGANLATKSDLTP